MRNLDLNLLRVFDAIIREKNVLRASELVNLSPSAVSHALSRLRALLNDELFVRMTNGMEPTVRALEMAPLVRDALVAIERGLRGALARLLHQSGVPCALPLPWQASPPQAPRRWSPDTISAAYKQPTQPSIGYSCFHDSLPKPHASGAESSARSSLVH